MLLQHALFVTGFGPKEVRRILTENRTGIIAHQMGTHITLENSGYLRRAWDVETIGITPNQEKPLTTGKSQTLHEFRDSYRIEHDRSPMIPEEKYLLSPNRDTAERRFRTL